MKRIFCLLLLTFVGMAIKAQTTYTPAGRWRWTSGSDTIDFQIKPAIITADSTTSYAVLLGFTRYVKNGVIVQDNISDSSTNYIADKFSFILFDDNTQFSRARIDGMIKDVMHNENRYLIFKKIDPGTLDVTLTYIEGGRRLGTPGFTLPRHFVLRRL